MVNSKLILILKTLSKKEMKELKVFISTPIFNKNKDVINLLSILSKQHPEFLVKNLSHTNISKKLYQKDDIKRLRYAMTDLTKQCEKFIAYKNFEYNESLHLLNAYKKRGLNKFFNQELTKQNQLINEKSQIRDEGYYQNQQELSEISFLHTLENDNRNIDTQLQNLVDNLDLYYLSKKLKYSCEIINRMNVLKVDYDVKLLNNLLDYINENNIKETPPISTYFQVLKTLQEPENEKHYNKLKKLISTHINRFKKEEQYDLYGYLQNYCIKKINSGNNNYLKELFNNYASMLTNKVIIKNNLIAQFDFKNMVTVALRVGEFEWTKNFIENYQSYLPEEHRLNATTYNTARLAFYQKNYKICLHELLKVEFTDIYYSLDSRALLLKTYYQLNNFESALSLINSFKIFLKRDKKISEYQNITYSNFLKIALQLVQLQLGYKRDINKVDLKLKNTQQIADSTWLQEKVNELKI